MSHASSLDSGSAQELEKIVADLFKKQQSLEKLLDDPKLRSMMSHLYDLLGYVHFASKDADYYY